MAVAVAAQEYYEGDGTAYTLDPPSAGNCNFMTFPKEAVTQYAALNDPMWLGTKNCGRCAEVSCNDDRCADKSKVEVVHLVDRCPECAHGSLDLSPTVFKSLTGSDPARYKIRWRYVDCPVEGNIKYCLKAGSNPFWTAIQPANTVAGVQSLQINDQMPSMVDSAYYYLLNGQGQTQTDLSKVKVTLTSVGGEVVEETVSLTAGSCVEGKSQFKRGKGGASQDNQQQQTGATTPPPPVPTTAAPPPATSAAPTQVQVTVAPPPATSAAPTQVQVTVAPPPTDQSTKTTASPPIDSVVSDLRVSTPSTTASDDAVLTVKPSSTPTPTQSPSSTVIPVSTTQTQTKTSSSSTGNEAHLLASSLEPNSTQSNGKQTQNTSNPTSSGDSGAIKDNGVQTQTQPQDLDQNQLPYQQSINPPDATKKNDPKQASVQAKRGSSITSPAIIALVGLLGVGVAALLVAYLRTAKKNRDEKRRDLMHAPPMSSF